MKLLKNLTLFHDNIIVLQYVSEEFSSGNTSLAVYDKYKISILLSDGLNAVMRDQIVYGTKNCVLVFRPDELHFGRISRSGIHSYLDILLPLSLSEQFQYDEAIDFMTDQTDSRVNCITFDLEHQMKLSKLASAVIELLQNEDEKSDVRLFSLILRIILLCSDGYAAVRNNSHALEIPALVKKTMLFISQNFDKQLTLEMLASHANCSVTYLSRLFKEHTGLTIYNYITSMRITHAQMMLSNGASVTDACFASGFNDCSNFIQKFKKATGKTPLQFKNAKLF